MSTGNVDLGHARDIAARFKDPNSNAEVFSESTEESAQVSG